MVSSRWAAPPLQRRIRQGAMLPELPGFFSAVLSRSRLGQTMCCADQGATLHHLRHPRRFGPSAADGNDRYRALLEIHRRGTEFAEEQSEVARAKAQSRPGIDA